MPHDVTMPQLGMAQDAGKIVSWLKAPGDPVAEGDALFEVETDKATMEVEATASGFLTAVTAAAGDDVPVGQIIARISDQADIPAEAATAPEDPTPSSGLPDGVQVTMPQLGMAQDSGILVGWLKSPGDPVKADEVLFEVETDKSTMEVPAGADGYLAATLAQAGEEVPVGDPVAIISAEALQEAVVRSVKDVAPATNPAPPKASKPDTPKAGDTPAPAKPKPAVTEPSGRILASPKLRRLAMEQGLDLKRLVDAGHPQPFHAADLDVLKALPTHATACPATATRHLTAEVSADGFADFADWAAENAGLSNPAQLLAGLAAASLSDGHATVAVEHLGTTQVFSVTPGPLGAIAEAAPDSAYDLLVRDLRMSRITSIALGANTTPVLSLTRAGTGLSITLECAGDQLGASEAVTLLSEFAGRTEQPLRHLL